MLEDAWTAGYPFPINPATGYFYVRAFGGHVVGEGAFQDRVGNPGIYELSFHCPRGLSGAPLCVNRSQQIAGIIVGNRMTSMTVFREREVLDDGASVQELIRDEIMRIGIAIKARSVFEARFDSLGCTVGEWLTRHGLV